MTTVALVLILIALLVIAHRLKKPAEVEVAITEVFITDSAGNTPATPPKGSGWRVRGIARVGALNVLVWERNKE